MAPCNGTTPSPRHSTLQWHRAMAPSNGSTSTPQSWSSPSIAQYNGTLSGAPCNGTLVPRPIRQSGSSPSPGIGSKNPYSYRYLGKNSCQSIFFDQRIHIKNLQPYHDYIWNMLPKYHVPWIGALVHHFISKTRHRIWKPDPSKAACWISWPQIRKNDPQREISME